MDSLRKALYLQAVLTALVGLVWGGSTAFSLTTMVVAAGAVFVGAALLPTPAMRTAVLGYESVAVAFGVLAGLSGHLVPATLAAVVVLVQVSRGSAALAFTEAPVLAFLGLPDPVASVAPVLAELPAPPPVVPPQPLASPVLPSVPPLPSLPTVPPQPEPTVLDIPAPSRPLTAAATLTVLPGR